jgi:hypothetical protein
VPVLCLPRLSPWPGALVTFRKSLGELH